MVRRVRMRSEFPVSAFFVELGLELEGEATVEGRAAPCSFEVVNNDADVVHPLDRHAHKGKDSDFLDPFSWL